MNSKLPPLPVDLNNLPDISRSPQPGPIGSGKVADYAPKRFRVDSWDKKVAQTPKDKDPEHTFSPPVPESIVNLEQITDEVNKLLMASAQAMVTEANNLLAQTQAWADNLNLEIKAKVAEHSALTERLKTFGKKVLEAHNSYHDSSIGEKD